MVIPISELSDLCRAFMKNNEKDQSELLFTEFRIGCDSALMLLGDLDIQVSSDESTCSHWYGP